jgi:hypothetical protein
MQTVRKHAATNPSAAFRALLGARRVRARPPQVIFTHDLIHCSWHATDTYRRVVHLTFSSGSEASRAAPDGDDAWLEYVLRDKPKQPARL